MMMDGLRAEILIDGVMLLKEQFQRLDIILRNVHGINRPKWLIVCNVGTYDF